MYRRLLRPLLFRFPPEFIHRMASFLLLVLFRIPFIAAITRKYYCVNHPSLQRDLFGLRFPNPVGVAAGFDKEARLYNALANIGFGHVEIGTVTPVGQTGNPRPRLFRVPKDKALINRMGFNNEGVEIFARNLKKHHPKVIIGGNIGKNTATPNEKAIHDYCKCFEVLFDLVDYFVINISCPNIKGLNGLQDKDNTLALLRAIQEINFSKPKQKPVLLKISPDLNDSQLDDVLNIIRKTKLDGVVATNTSSKRSGLSSDPGIIEKIGQGGLSGKPLQAKALRSISYLFEKSNGTLPIIGVGGIFTAEDALEMIMAGASLVQVYTGFIYEGPYIAKKINKQLIRNSKRH